MATIAHRLAQRAQAVSIDDVGPEVTHTVKRRVLDSIGCPLGAWSSRPAQVTRGVARSVTAADGASLLGSEHRTLPQPAALSNGALVRYLDFNDTCLSKEPAHPSDSIPGALAAGQACGPTADTGVAHVSCSNYESLH